MHDIALINVVTQLTASFDHKGIAWCVIRNYETFPRPRTDTSDLDIMLACKPERALGILAESAHAPIGIGKFIVSRSNDVISIFLTLPDSPALHLDFVFDDLWMGCALNSAKALLKQRRYVRGVPIPAQGHEVAVSLIHYLFHRSEVKPEYRQKIQVSSVECRTDFVTYLASVWGARAANTIADHAAAGEWTWFATWQQGAKRKLLFRACIRPLSAIATLVRFLANTGRRILLPPGLWIAFLGPDGCGKSTVGQAYGARLNTLFPLERQRHLHWRPGWLPAPGKLAGTNTEPIDNTQPHAKPPYGSVLSLARLFYFWLDFVVGHWLKVRPLLAKGGLVTFDRYYHDFLIDPRRYRLKLPAWLLRATLRLVPQPELVFVLDAPAEVLHARKQELPQTEISAQLEALRRLSNGNPPARIINVDRPLSEIIDELEIETLNYLDLRNRHQLGWT